MQDDSIKDNAATLVEVNRRSPARFFLAGVCAIFLIVAIAAGTAQWWSNNHNADSSDSKAAPEQPLASTTAQTTVRQSPTTTSVASKHQEDKCDQTDPYGDPKPCDRASSIYIEEEPEVTDEGYCTQWGQTGCKETNHFPQYEDGFAPMCQTGNSDFAFTDTGHRFKCRLSNGTIAIGRYTARDHIELKLKTAFGTVSGRMSTGAESQSSFAPFSEFGFNTDIYPDTPLECVRVGYYLVCTVYFNDGTKAIIADTSHFPNITIPDSVTTASGSVEFDDGTYVSVSGTKTGSGVRSNLIAVSAH